MKKIRSHGKPQSFTHATWQTPPVESEVRLWTYIASKPLSSEEVNLANIILSAFVRDWTSHGDAIFTRE